MDYEDAKNIGDEGEAEVHKIIREALGPGRFALDDILLDVGDATSQIDHVFIDRFGILTIETKCRNGLLKGTSDDRQWTTCYSGKRREQMLNPLRQNDLHRKRLHQALAAAGSPLEERYIQSVIVFANGVTEHLELNEVDQMRVVNLDGFRSYLADRENFHPNPGQADPKRVWGKLLELDRSTDPDVVARHAANARGKSGRRSRPAHDAKVRSANAHRRVPKAAAKASQSREQPFIARLVVFVIGFIVLSCVLSRLPMLLTSAFIPGGTSGVSSQVTQPTVAYNVSLARQRLREAAPDYDAALVDPEHPTLGTARGLPSYTWTYLEKAKSSAVRERTLTVVLDTSGNIVSVDGR